MIKGGIKVLGDPHLGRSFINDVPLHRRGERENIVIQQFIRELEPDTASVHVCLGDLFDKAVVPYDTILMAARSYVHKALHHPTTTFIVMRGNHDISRDLTSASAFDVFTDLVSVVDNIVVVPEFYKQGELGFFGWHPTKPAAELIQLAAGCSQVYGHWDTDPRTGTHNLIPTKEMAELGITLAVTGHVHKKTVFKRDGVDVIVWGSMQPYAHGEETNTDLYVTLTLDELADHDVTNKCVRVLLNPGEVVESIPDCLQFKTQLVGEVEAELPEITLGTFDFQKRFGEILKEHSVPEEISEQVKVRWNDQHA